MTVTGKGVVPDGGLTASQLPLLAVAVAVNVRLAVAVVETLIDWLCGTVAPVWKLKVSAPGVATNADVVVVFTFITTGIVVVLFPEVMLINPAYVPTGREPGLTETDNTSGVVPEVGVTVSQLALGTVLTVKFTCDELFEVTTRFCAGVALLPLVVKVSCVGLTVIGAFCAER